MSRTAPAASQRAGRGMWKVPGFAALFALAAGLAAETRPAAEQAKIDWLLAEIQRSNAIFIRNGKEYKASTAVSHLRRKLAASGRRVQTARDFILAVASRSERSGRPYEIRLSDGEREKLQTWLLARLSDHERPQTGD
ncbi:MAG: DUF5329 family protein [Thermoanaerobaculia bacterium]